MSKESVHAKVIRKVGKKLSDKLHKKGIHNEAYVVNNKIKVIVRKLPWIAQMSVKSKIESSVKKGLEKQGVEYDLEVNRERTSIRLYRYDKEELTSELEKELLERDRALTELPEDKEKGEPPSRRRDSSWLVRLLGRRGTDASCADMDDFEDCNDDEQYSPPAPPKRQV
jgi:hypothetical protein